MESYSDTFIQFYSKLIRSKIYKIGTQKWDGGSSKLCLKTNFDWQYVFLQDIIHCHDWSSAPVAWLFQDFYKHDNLAGARIIFTIHNLEFGAAQIGKAMANAHMATTVCCMHAREQFSSRNYSYYSKTDDAKLLIVMLYKRNGTIECHGIISIWLAHNKQKCEKACEVEMCRSDWHTLCLTVDLKVSPTYAREVSGNPAIAPHWHKFHGILNGIDPDIWDPYTDPFLPVIYFSDVFL